MAIIYEDFCYHDTFLSFKHRLKSVVIGTAPVIKLYDMKVGKMYRASNKYFQIFMIIDPQKF